MKKSEIKELARKAIEAKTLCCMKFKYDYYYLHHFPIKMSDRLFLGAKHDDFLLDGFVIRRFCDMTKIELNDDKRNEILKAEGIVDALTTPDIDLSDWHSVFLSLQKTEKNIIIEKESLDDAEWKYAIGHIEKVLKNKVLFKHFDADGIWQDGLLEIPFSQITTVTFRSRYVEIFSKYV